MHTISYSGKIVFEPENKTKKHKDQANWKKVAMVVFDDDIEGYYRWFMEKRFNLTLFPTLRGTHLTFINDGFLDINDGNGTDEEKEALWEAFKKKWDGKRINVTFNLRPFNDLDYHKNLESSLDKKTVTYHWWLIVDHKFRKELHDIRAEVGLRRPYFGLHMTFGILTQNFQSDKEGNLLLNEKGEKIPLFNHQLEHAKYLNALHEKGLIEINKDYSNDIPVVIKRIPPEKVDLYDSKDELIATLYNEYELNHVRIQIAQKQLEGYYVMWRKIEKIPIESNGSIKIWPKGFYDIQENQLAELFIAQKENKKEVLVEPKIEKEEKWKIMKKIQNFHVGLIRKIFK